MHRLIIASVASKKMDRRDVARLYRIQWRGALSGDFGGLGLWGLYRVGGVRVPSFPSFSRLIHNRPKEGYFQAKTKIRNLEPDKTDK